MACPSRPSPTIDFLVSAGFRTQNLRELYEWMSESGHDTEELGVYLDRCHAERREPAVDEFRCSLPDDARNIFEEHFTFRMFYDAPEREIDIYPLDRSAGARLFGLMSAHERQVLRALHPKYGVSIHPDSHYTISCPIASEEDARKFAQAITAAITYQSSARVDDCRRELAELHERYLSQLYAAEQKISDAITAELS